MSLLAQTYLDPVEGSAEELPGRFEVFGGVKGRSLLAILDEYGMFGFTSAPLGCHPPNGVEGGRESLPFSSLGGRLEVQIVDILCPH